MRNRVLPFLVAFAFVVEALCGVANAEDYCIDFGTLFHRIVGKGFRMPSRGRCKPFYGFVLDGLAPTTNAQVTGSVCVRDDGTKANVHVARGHTEFSSSPVSSVTYSGSLTLPAGTGTLRVIFAQSGGVINTTYAVTAAPCPTPIPVP